MRISLLLLFLLCAQLLSAQTYYWVGGAGNWSDLSHWANCSGCAGGAFAQVPQSTNDVVIDAGSGFAAVPVANNRTITLNTGGANATCNNLTVQPDAAGFRFSGIVRMDVYGSVTLSSNMNAAQTLWLGNLFLFGSGTHTHSLANIRLYNPVISVEPTGGQHTIDRPNWGTQLRLNPSAAGSVSITTSMLGDSVVQTSGNAVVNVPMAGYGASGRLNYYGISGGVLTANQTASIVTLNITGGQADFMSNSVITTFNLAGNTAVANFAPITHTWTSLNALTNNTSQLNIQNATINGLANWYWYYAATQLNATGSTLDFTGTGTANIVPGGQAYHNVYFRKLANIRRSNSTASTGLGTGSFNELVFEKGLWTIHASTYTINPNGLLRLLNGGMYNQEGTYLYTVPPIFTLNLGDNARTEMLGTCQNLLYLRRLNFNFAPNTAANINSDFVRMEEVNATGPEAPYQAGTNSHAVPNSTNANWAAGTGNINDIRPGRYLRWVGPVPADPTNPTQYAAWHNPNNWANGNLFPNAAPGDAGGECPPILFDTVVFPNNAYVRVDSPFIETHSMTWLGAGSFRNINYANNNALLEIYGSLQWSPNMDLLYNGVIKFRAWDNHHTIRSNTKNFPFKVIVETTTDTGTYRLLDAMTCPNTSNDYIFELRRGHFNTDGQTFTTENLLANGSTNVRTLSLGSSTINIMGPYLGNNRYCFETNNNTDNLTINAGTSHIHIQELGDVNTTNHRILIGSGHHFHKITFYGDRPWLFRRTTPGFTSYHQVDFRHSGTIYAYNGCRDSFHILRTHTINPLAINTFSITENASTATMIVDSAYFFGNVSFTRDVDYAQLMFLNKGHNYALSNNTVMRQQILATGLLDAKGTCQQVINISGGYFTSPVPQTADYLVLTDNTALSNNFGHSNTVEVGTVVGWSGVNAAPRVLYWYNAGVGQNTGDWNDPRNWSLADGLMLDANGGNDPAVGNCPPTRVDDVYFTDNSFDNPGDIVRVNLFPKSAECANMYWTMTSQPATLHATSVNERLNIFGSLQFSPVMGNNFVADVYFLGSGNNSTIRSNSIAFRRGLIINGANSTWRLLDDINVPNPIVTTSTQYAFYLQQGTLNTDGHRLTTHSFFSNYTTTRRLELGSSFLDVTSSRNPCLDLRGANFSIDAGTSYIRFLSNTVNTTNFRVYLANNVDYYGISGEAGQVFITGTNIDAHHILLKNGGWLDIDNSRIHKVESTTTTTGRLFDLYKGGNTMDSVLIAGNAYFRGSNYYTQLLQLSPARTYTFFSGVTQHLANAADFYAVGTGGGGEIFFNANTTNSQSYIRKDSGQVCVDFIYMRDIWAVGNGASTETTCPAFTCDTAQISSLQPSFSTAGRAIFQGGGNANDQGNNAGWDFTPYPPAPLITLRYVPPFAVCTNEPYVAAFEVVGQFPIDVSLSFDFNGTPVQVDSFDIRPTQGSGTIADPYIWYVSFMPTPVGITKIAPTEINVIRCFNGTAPGTGLNEAFVAPCLLSSELLDFSGTCHNGTNLRWLLSQNSELVACELERSQDGTSFYGVASFVRESGQQYFEWHDEARPALTYYRLRMLSRDGSLALSRVIAVRCDNTPTTNFHVFPNPSKGQFNIQFYSAQNGTADLEVVDALGRLLSRQHLSAAAGDNLTALDLSDLPDGIYLLRLRSGEATTYIRRIHIQK